MRLELFLKMGIVIAVIAIVAYPVSHICKKTVAVSNALITNSNAFDPVYIQKTLDEAIERGQ